MSAVRQARLSMLAAAALFSTGGTVIKLVSLGGWQVACLRSGVAALALLAFTKAARIAWSWRTLLVGLAYAVTLILFVRSNKLTTAANAIFLQSTALLHMLWLGPLLLKERVTRRDLALLGVLLAGLALFFVAREGARETATDPQAGNLLAAISGFTWALTVGGLRWLARAAPAGDASASTALGATVVGNALACLLCAPFALPLGEVPLGDAAWILFLGVVQIALAYVCLVAAVRRLPAFEAALLLLLEPVASGLLAWVVHGERPGPWALGGAALIVVATIVHASRARG
jgi:drug/metabolite transporter, DME family